MALSPVGVRNEMGRLAGMEFLEFHDPKVATDEGNTLRVARLVAPEQVEPAAMGVVLQLESDR